MNACQRTNWCFLPVGHAGECKRQQPCGHSMDSIKGNPDGGTHCSECFPNGCSEDEYVVQNVRHFALNNGAWLVASMPPQLQGRVACTPFDDREQSEAFAKTLVHPAWVMNPQGELVSKFELGVLV